MNKENKVLFGAIIGILFIILLVLTINSSSKKMATISKVVSEVLESPKVEVLYLDNGDCNECGLLSAQMPPLLSEYDLGYYYLNAKDMPLSKREQVLDDLGIKKIDVPMILIYNQGKLVDKLEGVNSVSTIFEFFQKGGIISEDKELVLNYLDSESYKKLLRTSGKHLLVIGSAKDNLSNEAQVILWSIAKSKKIKINIFILSDITAEEGAEFESSVNYYKEKEINVPDLLIVEKGQVLKNFTGLGTEEEYIEFLIDNEIIKE